MRSPSTRWSLWKTSRSFFIVSIWKPFHYRMKLLFSLSYSFPFWSRCKSLAFSWTFSRRTPSIEFEQKRTRSLNCNLNICFTWLEYSVRLTLGHWETSRSLFLFAFVMFSINAHSITGRDDERDVFRSSKPRCRRRIWPINDHFVSLFGSCLSLAHEKIIIHWAFLVVGQD